MAVSPVKFDLPAELNAISPPERRGIRRDHVRCMVLNKETGHITHSRFFELDQFLERGDLLILNSSRTVPAVLRAEWRKREGQREELREPGVQQNEWVEIRLANRLNESDWEVLLVGRGKEVTLGDSLIFSPLMKAQVIAQSKEKPLITIAFSLSGPPLYEQIYRLGQPIRYEYIEQPWDLDYYQTVYATIPGSVEMPSAGRAFSWELLFKLRNKGVRIAYIQLHAGLSYYLDEEWPVLPEHNYEAYEIPQETMQAIQDAKCGGDRIIAVGTTVVRCLESAFDERFNMVTQTGWTNLHIGERYPLKIVDGLITGFHEPEASHLDMLSAFMGPDLLRDAYQVAVQHKYLWHEFGDMNLII